MKKFLPFLFLNTILLLSFTTLSAQKIKVFILAGQSNAQGYGKYEFATIPGTLAHFLANDTTNEFAFLQDNNGNWTVRPDIWVRFENENEGLLTSELTVALGAYADLIGPELGMGHILGDYYDDQVMIIKTCWGGKSLGFDFRPPSSGGEVGQFYNQMIADISTAFNNVNNEFPNYNGEELELAGFVWFQGWNDLFEPEYLNNYQQNLINLINDVRNDLNAPNLPFIVGLTGNGGFNGDELLQSIQVSQINAAEHPAHQNVEYVDTRDFWREYTESPDDSYHHWNNNAESYLRIGDAFGKKLVELIDGINANENIETASSLPIIYPTLAHDYISFSNYNEKLEVNILDIAGKKLKSFSSVYSGQNLDISNFQPGIYFVELIDEKDNQVSVQKMIKH